VSFSPAFFIGIAFGPIVALFFNFGILGALKKHGFFTEWV